MVCHGDAPGNRRDQPCADSCRDGRQLRPCHATGRKDARHASLRSRDRKDVPYEPAAKKCLASNSYDKPGPIAFRDLLLATYGTVVGGLTVQNGITRPCDATISEHAEGRALDWGMDYRNATMHADGKAVLKWLFATDKYGNKDAMARRLGIMYVIWNKQIYGSWTDYAPAPYTCGTDPTACHVNHMHFSFDWAGARAQTSFFTGKVTEAS